MSILRDYNFRELSNFGGGSLLNDKTTVNAGGALLAQNVEYSVGQVGTRLGFGAVTLTGSVSAVGTRAMYAWYAPVVSNYTTTYSDANLVSLHTSGFIEVYNLKTGAGIGNDNFGSATGMSCAGAGMRLYVGLHDANQLGGYATRVGYVAVGGTPSVTFELAFKGPCNNVPTLTEPSAGVVTAGAHRVAYLMEFRTGFTTRLSPDTSSLGVTPSLSTFAPVPVNASGAKNLHVAFDFNAGHFGADYPAYISIAMTTASNLNQYYIVPGSRKAYTNTQLFTIDVSISDADLASQGVDATQYLYWLTSAAATYAGQYNWTTYPITPSHLCMWGDRMAYKATQTDNLGHIVDCVFVSERNNYQAITADQHILFLPGQGNITTLFRLGTSNYAVGPHEIYSFSDNTDVPVTWAAPHLVDGRHGTLAIHGVEVAPSGQYAWIADQSGLFLFDGSPITQQPLSSLQSPDWHRINWTKAYTLQIKDDASNKRVHVMVALDAATTPSHIMTWDYTDGATWDKVKYSLDSVSGYNLGAMELVRNDLTGQATANQGEIELWLGSTTSDTYLRKMTDSDTNPYRDNGAAIASTYRTCPLPGRDQAGGVILQHHGFHARLKGSGTITPVIYDIDRVRSFTCRTVTLATAPDQDILCMADMRGELAYVEFATNTLDTYFQLAYLKYYHSPYLMQR